MKRILAGLALALTCLAVSHSPASALVRPVVDDLGFKFSIANKINALADSAVVFLGGTERAETTATILTSSILIPPTVVTAAGADSALALIAYFVPVGTGQTGAATVAADSLYSVIQVSLDGANWVTASNTHSISTTIPGSTVGIAGSAQSAAQQLELASTNCFAQTFVISVRTAATADNFGTVEAALSGATTPDVKQLLGYPFFRFIFTSDSAGPYQFRYWHWADVVSPGER